MQNSPNICKMAEVTKIPQDPKNNAQQTPSKALEAWSKPHCTYGFNCGIIDAKHRNQYYHSNPMPYCKFGVNCTNEKITHRTTYYHYHNSPEVHEMLKIKLNNLPADLGQTDCVARTDCVAQTDCVARTRNSSRYEIKSSKNQSTDFAHITPVNNLSKIKSSADDILMPKTNFIQSQRNI